MLGSGVTGKAPLAGSIQDRSPQDRRPPPAEASEKAYPNLSEIIQSPAQIPSHTGLLSGASQHQRWHVPEASGTSDVPEAAGTPTPGTHKTESSTCHWSTGVHSRCSTVHCQQIAFARTPRLDCHVLSSLNSGSPRAHRAPQTLSLPPVPISINEREDVITKHKVNSNVAPWKKNEYTRRRGDPKGTTKKEKGKTSGRPFLFPQRKQVASFSAIPHHTLDTWESLIPAAQSTTHPLKDRSQSSGTAPSPSTSASCCSWR